MPFFLLVSFFNYSCKGNIYHICKGVPSTKGTIPWKRELLNFGTLWDQWFLLRRQHWHGCMVTKIGHFCLKMCNEQIPSLRRREIQLHSCRALWYRALRFKISKFTKQAFGGQRPTWPETSSVLHPYFVTDRCRWRLFSHIIKYHKFPPKTSEFQA